MTSAPTERCLLGRQRTTVVQRVVDVAPQVAGSIALLFRRNPTLSQPAILRLLEQGARRPQGSVPFDYQLGVGALDVVGTMAAFEARHVSHRRTRSAPELDVARPTLRASRPDAGRDPSDGLESKWRARKGAIADGFDAARLSLYVE